MQLQPGTRGCAEPAKFMVSWGVMLRALALDVLPKIA
jgi:hypothetical protein